jgi:predicted metal-dependent HD superfamily phosphohydrolase
MASHSLIVRFDVYCEQERMEYAFVPLPSYLEMRAKFLSSMAAAPSIYKSAEFKKLEAAARSNCSREAARLQQLLGGGH